MRYTKRILFIIVALTAVVGVTTAIAFGQNTQLQAVATPLEKAVMGVGGEEVLQNLSSFSIEAGGTRWIHDESFEPGSHAEMIGPFELQVDYDVSGDALRIEHTYHRGQQVRELSEVIVGNLGYLDGQYANFGPPGVRPMLSDRLASSRKHQWLSNPHLILMNILANPDMASEGGEILHEGSVHHLLVVEDGVFPITLYINAGTGRIAKLTAMESDALRRDVPIEVFYYSWQAVGEGLLFPAELYIAYDGDIVHKEIRTAIDVNPEMDSALFDFPDEVSPEVDDELAVRGEAYHLYLQSFAALGFPRDGLQTQIDAVELAPGIFHVMGGSHHSLAIEQENGIVIAEAPLNEARSQAVMEWVQATFPDKPISHAISSHHHVDHSAGLRSYVAAGTTAVMHEAAASYFDEIFLAGSTIDPDSLSLNPVEASITTVPADGELFLSDSTNLVELYPLENGHAEDMVLTYVSNGETGVVFVVDIYSPNPNAESLPPAAQLIHDKISELDLDVTLIAGGHGATIAFEDFESLLGDQ